MRQWLETVSVIEGFGKFAVSKIEHAAQIALQAPPFSPADHTLRCSLISAIVVDLLGERVITVDRSTVFRWVRKGFANLFLPD